jgi:hypothetical protein
MRASLRSLPAGSATPSGQIVDFHVEQAAGCLPEAHRSNASFWVAHYLETHVRAVDNQQGHNATIRREASAISKAVAKLISAMDAAGAETVELMGIAHGKNTSPDLGGGAIKAAEKFEIDWQDCGDFLQAVARAAGRVSSELPSQSRADSMHELVERLAKIWRSATGTRPTYYGAALGLDSMSASGFTDFCDKALLALPEGYESGRQAALNSLPTVVRSWGNEQK